MNYDKALRTVLSIFMLLFSLFVSAQSNGDKLFMEGQKLQQTQTVAAQKQAIRKFRSAKVVYTTADKKKMCDNQIKICNSNIASLSGGKKKSNQRQGQVQSVTNVESRVNLSVSKSSIRFDGDSPGTFSVQVTASSTDWTFNVPEGVDGNESFAKVTRSDDAKSLEIEVGTNPTTLERHQKINVTQGNVTRVISILQTGKSVTLSASENLLEFGLKGGDKSLELYTNSDLAIESNNGQTWYVESKPDWIMVNVDVRKEKGILGKGLSAIKGLVAGKAAAANAADVKTAELSVVATPIKKSSPLYKTGRKGEIVFASQDKKYKVAVVQQK